MVHKYILRDQVQLNGCVHRYLFSPIGERAIVPELPMLQRCPTGELKHSEAGRLRSEPDGLVVLQGGVGEASREIPFFALPDDLEPRPDVKAVNTLESEASSEKELSVHAVAPEIKIFSKERACAWKGTSERRKIVIDVKFLCITLDIGNPEELLPPAGDGYQHCAQRILHGAAPLRVNRQALILLSQFQEPVEAHPGRSHGRSCSSANFLHEGNTH
mmetsp:Transcript_36715/g.82654  ORF Transcript_36715/g.82654 Transcript_36715/m.82654 type:complete len:217 (-) Transcript_36715:2-652(-)